MSDFSLRPSGTPNAAFLRFQPLFIFCMIAFAALQAVLLWQNRASMAEGYGDFAAFYTAGKIVAHGESARLYDSDTQWQIQQEFASTVQIRRRPLPYIRPSFEALLFVPFAWLSYPAACVAWMAFKIALILALPFLLPPPIAEGEKIRTHALRSLLCLAFFPVGFDLLMGQDSTLLLFILALALRQMRKGADLQSGAIMALGLFKFHLILPLLLTLALAKRGRLVLGFAATATGLFLISLAMVHWSGLTAYPRYLLRLSSWPGFGLVQAFRMPTLRGLLTVLPSTEILSRIVSWLLLSGFVLAILVAARLWRADDREGVPVAFSFSIVIALLTTYYASSYDLTLLLLPLLLLGKPFLLSDREWSRSLFLAAASVLLCTPLLWFLVLRLDQFRWIALALLALAASIFRFGKASASRRIADVAMTKMSK